MIPIQATRHGRRTQKDARSLARVGDVMEWITPGSRATRTKLEPWIRP